MRYAETDRMGLLHHANYIVYFEMGRTELLRSGACRTATSKTPGHLLVVVEVGCKFKKPAYYDDLLTIRTIGRAGHARQGRPPVPGLPRRPAPGRGALDPGLCRPGGQAASPPRRDPGRRGPLRLRLRRRGPACQRMTRPRPRSPGARLRPPPRRPRAAPEPGRAYRAPTSVTTRSETMRRTRSWNSSR